jgi:hypothetical protein
MVFPAINLNFSYGFPMVFLWFSYGFPSYKPPFSYGFPMVFLWFSHYPYQSMASQGITGSMEPASFRQLFGAAWLEPT